MGIKLDALLGRNFKASKFKTLAKLAVSRVAILKNQRQSRYFYARSDVIELLNLGHHEEALSRVEYVIKEHNMLDALVMIEDYCHLLIERVMLIQKKKECPDELQEAISSLIFASSRCGELPELRKIRDILTSRFGGELAARSVELRGGCGVNPKIVQKFSSRQSSLKSRLKVLKEISTEMGVSLHLEEEAPAAVKEKLDVDQKQPKPTEPTICDDLELNDHAHDLPLELNVDEKLSESVKARKNYRDVTAAAHDAFESAVYAAAAARAAFELSRTESKDNDSDEDDDSSHRPRIESNSNRSLTPVRKSEEYAVIEVAEDSKSRIGFEKSHSVDTVGSESEREDMTEKDSNIHLAELEESESEADRGKAISASGSYSDQGILSKKERFSGLQRQNDKGKSWDKILRQEHDDFDINSMCSFTTVGYQHNPEYNGFDEQIPSAEDIYNKHNSPIVDSPKSLNDPMIEPVEGKTALTSTQDFLKQLHSQHSSMDWKKFSMRTRRLQKV